MASSTQTTSEIVSSQVTSTLNMSMLNHPLPIKLDRDKLYPLFDVNYQGPHAPASLTSQISPTPPAQALMAAPSPTSTDSWFLDSGTTHHLSHTATNIHNGTPYNGTDSMMVGNDLWDQHLFLPPQFQTTIKCLQTDHGGEFTDLNPVSISSWHAVFAETTFPFQALTSPSHQSSHFPVTPFPFPPSHVLFPSTTSSPPAIPSEPVPTSPLPSSLSLPPLIQVPFVDTAAEISTASFQDSTGPFLAIL
ncbi:hypothetical protein CK203_043933 [Vitis vinifera]|uniref:Uncharacterized protein n=1 Tax=Vitis vinifera TaxID=29760 RepID=A0A438HTD4_VITVI|nr:hypothetical protein CK203_043933 [Vitis vinifera]